MFITYPDVDNLSACEVGSGWRLVCVGAGGEDAGGWCARALSACAGVDVPRCLACTGLARAGYEGVARMWIGCEDVDSLITYPDVHNLSGCR